MKKALKEKGKKAHDTAHEKMDEGVGLEENRMAAMTAGESPMKTKPGARNAKITGGKSYTMKGKDGKPLFKEGEEVSITKEMVVEYLVSEGYANNEVSAEILHAHVSDGFLAEIEERMSGQTAE